MIVLNYTFYLINRLKFSNPEPRAIALALVTVLQVMAIDLLFRWGAIYIFGQGFIESLKSNSVLEFILVGLVIIVGLVNHFYFSQERVLRIHNELEGEGKATRRTKTLVSLLFSFLLIFLWISSFSVG
tara:strand:- start:540 stop:923 length:384 start_codon:yes stop_codon:yes gene_type:complete